MSGVNGSSIRSRVRVLLVGVVAAFVVVPVLAAPPAVAASVTAQRSVLWDQYRSASNDYNASWKMYGSLPLADKKYVGSKIDSGMKALKKVQPLIAGARTSYSLRKAKNAMSTARARAGATRTATWMLRNAMSARESARSRVNSHLASYVAGNLSESTYRKSAAAAAAVSTKVEADRKAALASLGRTVKPKSTSPLSAMASYASGNYALTPSWGWTGVPGGCALPTVSASQWLGDATEAGPHLWTNSTWESSARNLQGKDAEFDNAYEQVLRGGANEAARNYDWNKVIAAQYLPKRSLFLGLRWRETGDSDARTTLIKDVQKVVSRGPVDSPLQSAMTLEAMATSVDLTEPSESTRTPILEQLMVKWLGPASCQIADRSSYVFGSYNIPVVHNTAHSFGAIAVADLYPEAAASLLASSLGAIQPALRVLATDGGSPEGPEYWNFQTRYAAALYATVKSVYGNSPPVDLPDLSKTTNYWWSSTARNGQTFTHSDSQDIGLRPYVPGWWGFAHGDKAGGQALIDRADNSPEAWSIWWWPRGSHSPQARQSTLFDRTGVATLHANGATAWLKGGNSTTNHSHLDLGTVGYVKDDVLWAIDPYRAAYSSAYFNRATRWNFWEASTQSHSTLRVGGKNNQWSKGYANFAGFSTSRRVATLDMRKAISGAKTARRSIAMYSSGSLKVSDQVTTSTAQQYVWQWTTDASVSVSGKTVTLKRSGRSVKMTFSGLPSGSYIRVVSAPSGKRSADGLTMRQVNVVTPKVKALSMAAFIG